MFGSGQIIPVPLAVLVPFDPIANVLHASSLVPTVPVPWCCRCCTQADFRRHWGELWWWEGSVFSCFASNQRLVCKGCLHPQPTWCGDYRSTASLERAKRRRLAGEWLAICCKGREQPGSVIFPNFLATALADPPWWFFGFLGRDPGGCEGSGLYGDRDGDGIRSRD